MSDQPHETHLPVRVAAVGAVEDALVLVTQLRFTGTDGGDVRPGTIWAGNL